MGRRSNSQKKKSPKLTNLDVKILQVMKKAGNQPMNYKQIAGKLKVTDASGRNQIIKKIAQLAAKQQIQEEGRGKYIFKASESVYTGVVDVTSKGSAYVIVEELEEDIFIPSNAVNTAFDGDTVEVYVYRRKRKGNHEGEINSIIKRKKTEFIGIIQVKENFAFVDVKDNSMYTDFFIPKEKINGANDGEMVLIDFEDWPEKADSPFGSVKEVLGIPGEHETEIHAILLQYGLPYEFPKKVEQYANEIDTSITEAEVAKRRDMRKTLTFTIDPKDAKDFDDALSFKVLENGNYEVGVHIADVSHYLQPGTILDDEAYERATSVYLVDRVVPMLPEILSNNACSLRPHEEKYTFSAVFEITNNAELVGEWFGRTATYSDARFAYEEAQQVIETGSNLIPAAISLTGEAYEVSNPIAEAILKLDELAKIMRKARMESGALSFDKTEVKFNLDENNEPIGVFFKTSKDANKLIEEFMLLANKKVSEFIGKQDPKKTFVYRVHDEPNEEKLASLQTVVSQFGYNLNLQNKKTVISSLNKRLLQHYLDGGKSEDEVAFEEKCKHSSEMEGLAANAERDSIKFMQIKFMHEHQHESFAGVISGVTEWGIYVEIIQNKCEGMIRLRDLNDDHYQFIQDEYAVVGKRTGKKYVLGDEVLVKVKNADLIKRHLDFTFVDPNEQEELVHSTN